MSDERELVEALAEATEDRAMLRAALSDTVRQLAQTRREQQATKRCLRGLEQSRSWQLTRPLREAGATYRKLSQRVKARAARRA